MKTRDKIISIMFCLFIGAMAIMTVLLPKRDFSENEKRVLASFPSLSEDKLLSGKWERDFEGYISDHFPAREAFAATDAYFMLYTGRNGSDGIYKGRDGYLFSTPVKSDKKKLDENIKAINDFAQKTGIPTKLMAVPSAGAVLSEKLPQNHLTYSDYEIISDAKEKLKIQLTDLTDVFEQNKDKVSLYYKTDHHWTSGGAYLAYRLWAEGEGISPREKADYTITEEKGFYGTSYSKSALWLTEPDTIELWEYPINVTVTIENRDEHDSMFFKKHLSEPDKYPVYLDGNHAVCTVVNHDNQSGKKILLIKDSYAHCFAPFLAENCSRIDMIDLRYYTDTVSELASRNNYDEVLILCGISSLCEENDLSLLE